MRDATILMQPRSPTFCERMRLTYTLFLMGLPLPSAWLRAVWSIGARVSFSPIDQLPARLHIESGDGQIEVMVTISKRHMTTK